MKTTSRRLFVLLQLFILAALGGCSHPHLQPAADALQEKQASQKVIVAVVNSAPITMDTLIRTMNRTKLPDHGELPASYQEQIRKSSLDRLILQELVYQQAKAAGLTVDRTTVDHLIATFRDKFGGDKQVAEFLAKEGLSEAELYAQVERTLLLEKIYAQEVTAKAVVSEDELRTAFEREQGNLVLPETLKVVDVVVFLKEGEKTARGKAVELKQQIAAAKDQDPWQLVLDGSFLVRAMDLRKAPEKNRILSETARTMKENEISDILKGEDGLHIIKVTEHAPQRQMTFEEARPALEVRLRGAAHQKRLEEWTRELKANAEIVIREEMTVGQGKPADDQGTRN